MQELSSRCSECNDGSCQIVIGDTFTVTGFVFHMRCDICGHDYEAGMKRAFKVIEFPIPPPDINDYTYRFQQVDLIEGEWFATFKFRNENDHNEQWIVRTKISSWIWYSFFTRTIYRIIIAGRAVGELKEKLTIEEEKKNGETDNSREAS